MKRLLISLHPIILYISASQRAGISIHLGDYEALDGWTLSGFERGTLRVGVTGSEPLRPLRPELCAAAA